MYHNSNKKTEQVVCWPRRVFVVCVTFCDLISCLHNVKIIRLTRKPETGDLKWKISPHRINMIPDLFTPNTCTMQNLRLNFEKFACIILVTT